MRHYTKSDGSCWLQRYAANSDEVLHNYPATHFGRTPPPSKIQSRHWKRRGLEPVLLAPFNFPKTGAAVDVDDRIIPMIRIPERPYLPT
jgi:hypothetical protein